MSRCLTARGLAASAGAVVLLVTFGSTGSSAREPLKVRASEAFAPVLRPALEAFTRESGIPTALDVREPDPPGDADVVVGDDSELTRVLEGGAADLGTSVDLGYLPWVLVVPAGSPADLHAAVAGEERLCVLGGRLGRDARAALGGKLPARVQTSRDAAELRRARYALVPRSLAGPGEQRDAGLPPLVAVAAAVSEARDPAGARQLLAFLTGPHGRAVLGRYLSPAGAGTEATATGGYAVAVVDWWEPQCSLEGNWYTDPRQVLGPPDAVYLGFKDGYTGMMSLGQGGYVTVDMGTQVVDGTGPDLRVFQTTSNEPVTVYAAASPQGPFTLVRLRVPCGHRSEGLFSGHCDFDLHDAGLTQARYFKIEDGEIYPCLLAGTHTEGADIDAVQALVAGS
ncbi:MAG TPA: hypothetical protein VMX54_13330 [Vicinamibacteria bacterium]|nr:hypothetical protein [Vicinamibacteria bacterium]